MSLVVSPNPECLPGTMFQTWAKSARIQSQRLLSHESFLIPPFLSQQTIVSWRAKNLWFQIYYS